MANVQTEDRPVASLHMASILVLGFIWVVSGLRLLGASREPRGVDLRNRDLTNGHSYYITTPSRRDPYWKLERRGRDSECLLS